MKLSSVRRALAAVVTAGLVAAPLVVSAPADAGKPGRPGNPPAKPVTVMTRNLYLGADINRPVDRRPRGPGARRHPSADPRRAGERDPRDPGHRRRHRLHGPRGPVGRRDRGDRAGPDRAPGGRLVATRSPRARARSARPTRPRPTTTSSRSCSTTLDARGVAYVPVSIAPRADVEAPSFTGSPRRHHGADARDVRLTMRDVVLMHVEDGLTALDEGQAVYDVQPRGRRCWATRSASTAGTSGSTSGPAPSGSGSSTPTSRRSAPTSPTRRPPSSSARRRPTTPRRSSSATATPTRSTTASSRRTRVPHKARVRADHRRRWLHRRVAEVGTGRGRAGPRASARPSTTRPATTSTTASTWSSPGRPPARRSPWTGARSPAPTCPPRTRRPASGPPTTAGWCSGSAASEAPRGYSRAVPGSSERPKHPGTARDYPVVRRVLTAGRGARRWGEASLDSRTSRPERGDS